MTLFSSELELLVQIHADKKEHMFEPDIYWIRDIEPLRMAIMPRPRADDWLVDEVQGWHRAGVSVVVSLLEDEEVRELRLLEERSLCQELRIEFISFPIPDRGVPKSMPQTKQLAQDLLERLRMNAGVAIHCRAGIGRSSLIAGCVLSLLGHKPVEAFRILSIARKVPVPDTLIQEDWLTKVYAQHRLDGP